MGFIKKTLEMKNKHKHLLVVCGECGRWRSDIRKYLINSGALYQGYNPTIHSKCTMTYYSSTSQTKKSGTP